MPPPITRILMLSCVFLLSLSFSSGWNTVLSRRSYWREGFVRSTSLAGVSSLLLQPSLPAAASNDKSAVAVDSSNLSRRFDANFLRQPPVSAGSSEMRGVDNFYFPDWMEGTWSLKQTLVNFSTPLGLAFVGGPNGDVAIADKVITDIKSRLGVPVEVKIRFVKTPWGVAEDRLFNTQQRLDSFAGRNVVASVGYADVGGSNRASVLAMGGSEKDPLQTTLVRFKGPAAQKIFCTGHSSRPKEQENQALSWFGYEFQRSIFALTNTNTAPPITTDQEILWNLERAGDNVVRGRLRLAGYLIPTEKLYFDAKNRAASLQDYTLDMVRLD